MHKGHIIENYRLNKVIGRGGTAIVWSVSNTLDNDESDERALKVFNAELDMDRKSLTEIQNQYHRQRTIQHPNIVSPISLFDNDGVPAILFEKAEMSLLNLLQLKRKEGGFNENQLVDILGDITSGLMHLHYHEDLAHNDVKTDNVLVFKIGNEFSYKLCDLDTSTALRATIMLRLTRQGDRNDIFFTPLYVAPEKKDSVDSTIQSDYDHKKADVFSLGATMLELCTALDQPVEQLIKQNMLKPLLATLNVSNRMKGLLASMLEKEPSQRLALSEVSEIVNFRQNNGFWPEIENEPPPESSKAKYMIQILILFLVFAAFGIYKIGAINTPNFLEKYQTHTPIINGFACVCNEKCGVVDKNGNEMQILKYSTCEHQGSLIILDQDTFEIRKETLLKLN